MPELDLHSDVVSLTAAVCDVESVSHHESDLADAVEAALRALPHLDVERIAHNVVARTRGTRPERVLLAGHLDTVPLTDPPNLPVRREDGVLHGRGTVDMKGGVAVMLRLAAQLPEPNREVTFVFYEAEEVADEFNGLGHLARDRPELLEADFAVLLEPTDGGIEGGCKGTLRVDVRTTGVAAHSGRPWLGHNAIHDAGEILRRLEAYQPRDAVVDGLEYREGMSAVGIRGGLASNVVPDECVVTVNYRFAPDVSTDQAVQHVRSLFAGYDVTVTDLAAGARPGLDQPAAQAFVAALGLPVTAKQGWTDVARFTSLGVPAVNFGPGDPTLAHKDDERCPEQQLVDSEAALLRWLGEKGE